MSTDHISPRCEHRSPRPEADISKVFSDRKTVTLAPEFESLLPIDQVIGSFLLMLPIE